MIKVKKEPDEFAWFPLECCCFCKKSTRFWANEGETPVCRKCAKVHNYETLNRKIRNKPEAL